MLEFEYLEPISLNSSVLALSDSASSSCASDFINREDDPDILSQSIFKTYILPLKNYYFDKNNKKCQMIFKSLCHFEQDLKTFTLKELQELQTVLESRLGALKPTLNNFSQFFNTLHYEFNSRRPILGMQAEKSKKEAGSEEISQVFAFYKTKLKNTAILSPSAKKLVVQLALGRAEQDSEKAVDLDCFKIIMHFVQDEINLYEKACNSPKGFVDSVKYLFGRNRSRAIMLQDMKDICQLAVSVESLLPKDKLDFQDLIEDVLLEKLSKIKQQLLQEQGNFFNSQFLAMINKLQTKCSDGFTNEKQALASMRTKSLKKRENPVDLKCLNSILETVETALNNYEAKTKKPQNFVDSIKYVLGPNRSRAHMLAELRDICKQAERLRKEVKVSEDIDFQDFIKTVLLSKLKSIKIELLQENNLFASHLLNLISDLVQKVENYPQNFKGLKK